eukprot:3482507-Ditylum_brightwellii.AAC.1
MHHHVTRKHRHRNITLLQGYNHNVNSLKQDLKIEQLCQAFQEQLINFGCLQETWLVGDYQREIKTQHAGKSTSCLFFHHGQPIQTGPRSSGGVAILLGRGGIQAWKNAGSPAPIRSELNNGIAWSMGLELHIKDKHKKVVNYFVITAYHPDSEYGNE